MLPSLPAGAAALGSQAAPRRAAGVGAAPAVPTGGLIGWGRGMPPPPASVEKSAEIDTMRLVDRRFSGVCPAIAGAWGAVVAPGPLNLGAKHVLAPVPVVEAAATGRTW